MFLCFILIKIKLKFDYYGFISFFLIKVTFYIFLMIISINQENKWAEKSCLSQKYNLILSWKIFHKHTFIKKSKAASAMFLQNQCDFHEISLKFQ